MNVQYRVDSNELGAQVTSKRDAAFLAYQNIKSSINRLSAATALIALVIFGTSFGLAYAGKVTKISLVLPACLLAGLIAVALFFRRHLNAQLKTKNDEHSLYHDINMSFTSGSIIKHQFLEILKLMITTIDIETLTKAYICFVKGITEKNYDQCIENLASILKVEAQFQDKASEVYTQVLENLKGSKPIKNKD